MSFRGRARVVTHWARWSMLTAALLFSGGGVTMLLAGLASSSILGIFGAVIAFTGFGLAYASGRISEWTAKLCDIAVDDQTITAGHLNVSRAEIRASYVVPHPTRDVVRLRRNLLTSIDLEFDRVGDGQSPSSPHREFLAAIGHDAEHHALTMFTPSPLAPLAQVLVPLSLLLLASPLFFYGFAELFAFLGALVLVVTFAPRVVRIGADGIYVRWLHRKRFVPMRDVWRVTWYTRERSLGQLRVAEHVVLVAAPSALEITARSTESARILEERIWEAKRASGDPDIERNMVAALERGQRSAAEWLAHLRNLARRAGDAYRAEFLGRDELLHILADPAREPHLRVAAAAALSRDALPEEKTRIEAAVRQTAEPRVRVAMERALAPDVADETIATALEEIEQEARASRRSGG